MTKVKTDYIVGLDIGTNSCGWVATDKKNNILHLQGKTAIGSHLFEEGDSAADRRGYRTTRRRLNRRKWRLKFLEEIFDEPMMKVDPYFFARMRESGISPLDYEKHPKRANSIIFPTQEEDKKFYKEYPTIYHLRQALMTKDQKFDLRLIYLAIHHIVKYRGNFLQDAPLSSFESSKKNSKIDVKGTLENLNSSFSELNPDNPVEFALENCAQIEEIIRNKKILKMYKQKQISKLLVNDSNDQEGKIVKELTKRNKNIATQVAKAILGYKMQLETILGRKINKVDKDNWEFKLSDANADDKLDLLLPDLDDDEQEIVSAIKQLFGAITLSSIVDEGKTLSESMVRKYNDHKEDYKLLKAVVKSQTDSKKAKKLCLAYDLYVNNRHGKLLEAKKQLNQKGILSKDVFYELVKKNLNDSKAAKCILKKMKLDSFMPKQRINSNGVIPFQLHQIELDKIIANQCKYYPFLADTNPIKTHRKQAPYKLDELVRFRVPYYVGPMITAKDQLANSDKDKSDKSLAWMIRKEQGRITPWNFDEKVDRMASANKFIKRMTTKDTYLFGEDVLPANSLLYQKFTVLNELNNIRINHKVMEPKVKQDVYNALFKKCKTVSAKKLGEYLRCNHKLLTVEIEGLADPQKFNSSLSTYHQLKNTGILDDKLDDPNYQNDLEKIIEWSTIFEDKTILAAKLKAISWLTPKQIEVLAKIRYQGWGNLSRKLLVGLHNSNGQNIMEQLWDSKNNFMQIVNEPEYKAAIEKENKTIAKATNIEDILADAYTSPANKKAIRQVIKVVDDITKAAGGKAPAQFAIEFARGAEKNPKLSQVRGNALLKVYDDTAKEIVDASLKDELIKAKENRKLAKDKYYLYFMQGGRDAYTGEKINIDELDAGYQIDHILPQSFIKDDSLNNRVLTSSANNNAKSDSVPVKLFGNKQVPELDMNISAMWKKWKQIGLISKTKFNNLLTDPDHLTKYQRAGFINRQLVETSQIIKLVSIVLQAAYPKSEIIVVKASYNHDLRERLNLYKSREVNDYHHAIDAYLSTICGNYLYQVYPKLRPYFVYGQYSKIKDDNNSNKDAIKKIKTFDFIWELLRKDKPNNPAPEEIRQRGTNEVVFLKHPDIFDKLRKVYNYKYMLVSQETTIKNQEMFDMTVYPRAERDNTKKPRTLIPKAKDLDTNIYGGYTSNTDAYMAIVKINEAKKSFYKIIGVPMRALTKLKAAKEQKNYDQALKQILEPAIMYNNGKRKRDIKDFEIIKGKVPYKQVIQDGDKKFMLGSAAYMYNAKQLTLSQETMRIVTNNFNTDDDEDKLLIDAYDEILEKVDKYLPLYDINNFRNKLHIGFEKLEKLPVNDVVIKNSNKIKTVGKKNTIIQILKGLHDNSVVVNLGNLGLKTPFGKMQKDPNKGSGITLSSNAKLIYQSPTGLFEKRVKISDL